MLSLCEGDFSLRASPYTVNVKIDGLPFKKVLGTGKRVGSGASLYTYCIYLEDDIPIDPRLYAKDVGMILADKRGWIRGGEVSFQRVASYPSTFIILAKPKTVDKLCYPLDTEGEVSCCQGSKVVLNWHRWRDAVPHWKGKKKTYRQMLVNHEMGHRIGKGHSVCGGAGNLAPVMQQQTYGLQGCKENSWPLDSEL